MPRNNHHRCDDCGVLLAHSYPYNLCPKHWRQRYNAPPGKYRFDYFEAAANPARVLSFVFSPPLYKNPGSVIVVSEHCDAAAT